MKWKYYDAMNEVLGTRPATRPPIVIDTTENPGSEDDTELEDEMEGREETGETSVMEGEKGSSRLFGIVADGSSSGNTTECEEVKDSNCSGKERLTEERQGRKRSHSKDEMFEGMMSKVVKTIADGLRESDKMFMELEEKRRESEVQQ